MDNEAVETMIIATLAQKGTAKAKDFEEKMPGLGYRTVDNALRRLKAAGKIVFDKKTGWSLAKKTVETTKPAETEKPKESRPFSYDDEPETRDRVGT